MCEYSSKLILWMDGELTPAEAETVDRHLAECHECLEQADSFRKVSDDFALYIREAAAQPARSRLRYTAPVAIAAAALVAFVLLKPRPITQDIASIPQQAAVVQAPAIAPAKAAPPRVRHRARKPPAPWIPAEPTIQVLIPADALFPPGALPEGVGLVADFRLAADGSHSTLLSRPNE